MKKRNGLIMAFIMIWAIQLSAQAPRSPIEMAPVQPEPAPHRLIIRVSKSIASGMTISSIGTSSTSIQKIPKTGITSIDKLLKDNGAKEITKSFNFQPQRAFSAARIDAKTRRIQEIEDKLNRTYIVEFPSTVNLDSLKNQLKSNQQLQNQHERLYADSTYVSKSRLKNRTSTEYDSSLVTHYMTKP